MATWHMQHNRLPKFFRRADHKHGLVLWKTPHKLLNSADLKSHQPRFRSVRLAIFAAACAPIVIGACAAASRAPTGSHTAEKTGISDTLSLELRRRAFETVWSTVHETFWDSVYADSEWRQIGEQYRSTAMAERDSRRYHAVLDAMVGELRRSHFAVVAPEVLRERWREAQLASGTIGVSVRMIGGEPVVTRLATNAPAARAGLRPGNVIERIDSVLFARNSTAKIEGSDTGAVALGATGVLRLLEGAARTIVSVQIRDSHGKRRVVTIRRVPRTGAFERRIIRGQVPRKRPRRGNMRS